MKTNEKDTKQGVVPFLRFPEFSDVQEWKEIPMHQIGKTLTGLSGKNSSDFGCGKRYITYKQVYSDTVNDFDKCEKVFVNESEKQNCVQQGDVLFTTSSETPDEVGISSVILKPLPETIYLNSFCFILRPYDINNLYPQFAKYLFQSPTYRKRIIKLAQGAIRFNLSKAQFISLSLPIPIGLNEQQKIADCLSSIDALIKAAENKNDELKAHKKGLMQQLFPAEEKTVPILRFPEFQNAGEWKQTTIGAICTISNGKSNVQDNVQNGKYPLFDRSEIIKASNKFLFDCEAIIIPGEGRFIPKYYIGKFDLHQRAYALKDFTCHALFVYHYITAFSFILTQKAVKSTVLSLRMPILEAFPLLLPNIQEQQKIANCLSSVDDLITAQTNRLEALRNHKKGLMQQLFPNIDEC